MKKWIWTLVFLALLSGCRAEPARQTVEDELEPVIAVTQQPYRIVFGVPEDAEPVPAEEGESRKCYEQTEGTYEIVTDAVIADGIDTVIQELSGFPRDQLTVLNTKRGAMEEYRFAWASSSEGGVILSSAAVLEDGNRYYSLVFSTPEQYGKQCAPCMEAVFDSFSVDGEEGF